jgi:O-antigen/teichoic acid export membrane protein
MNKIKQHLLNLVAKISSIMKTDVLYLVKGGFWLSLGQGASSLAGLISAYFFANFLSREVYGIYTYCISIIGILCITALQGLSITLIQTTANGKDGFFLPAAKERAKWALIGGFISLGIAVYYFTKHDQALGAAFLIISLFIPIFDPLNSYGAFLTGKKDYKTVAFFNAATRFGPMLFIVPSLFLFPNNLVAILLVYLLAHTSFRALLFWITWKKYHPITLNDQKAMSFGKHLSFVGALGTLAGEIDKVLTFQFLGPAQLSIYSFAILPISQLKKPTSIISTLTLPKMSQRNFEELKKSVPKKMLVYFLFLLPMAVLYVLIAPWAYKIFFPQYMESVIYSQVFVISLLLRPVLLIDQALVSQLAKKAVYITKLAFPALKITLLILLLPRFHLWGVIAASILADFGLLIISYIVLKKSKITEEENSTPIEDPNNLI